MDATNTPTAAQHISEAYQLAWTAYIVPVIVFIIFSTIMMAISPLAMILPIALLIYQILDIRSVRLFLDDQGVWVFSGILPWSKGTRGVKWRDLDEAVYFTGFFSWLFKAYTIRVGHRFTKDSEFTIKHVKQGDQAVMRINALHQEKLSQPMH